MATKSLSDYFSLKTLPASGNFAIAKTTPMTVPQAPVNPLNKKVPSSLSQLSLPSAPVAPIVPPAGSPFAPPVNPSASPIFTPSGGGPDRSPIGPTDATGVAVPPQFLNADGSFKSPDEIAAGVGNSLKAAHGNGDIGTLALEQFGGNGKSAADLEAEARRIGNTRNDIAVGETDPYKVASESGIAYTPAELSAIEKAYAGVYDPALDTALAKVNAKQKEDEAKASGAFTLGKDQVRYDVDGNPIAVGISSDDGTGGGLYTKGANPVVDAYVEGSKNGTYKPSDIPDQYKDLVAQGVAQGKPNVSKSSTDAISNINALIDSGELSKITGLSNFNPLIFAPGASEAPLLNLSKQLKGILSLENRQQLKGSGAISDFEFRVLGEAASALGITDSGVSNLSETAFKKELQKLKLKLEVGETSLTDDELLHLQEKGYSADQIREYDQEQSFSSVGNTTASKTALNRPQRNNNPGNVKVGGLSDSLAIGKDDQNHLIFPDAKTGFKALTADLTAKINGGSTHLPANPTIAQLGKVYAEDPNWPKKVAAMLGVPVDTHTQAVPLANLVKAIATQEGFYA